MLKKNNIQHICIHYISKQGMVLSGDEVVLTGWIILFGKKLLIQEGKLGTLPLQGKKITCSSCFNRLWHLN